MPHSPPPPPTSWLVLRSLALHGLARDIETTVLRFIDCGWGARAATLSALSAWLVEAERRRPGTAREIRARVKRSPAVAARLASSAAADFAALVLGAEVRLHPVVRLRTVMRDHDHTHSRPHQDRALWPAENPAQVNMWLALCEVAPEVAPLRLLADGPEALMAHRVNEYDQLELVEAAAVCGRMTPVPVGFGELILFPPTMVHAAAPNTGPGVRWSIDFRFVAADPSWQDDAA